MKKLSKLSLLLTALFTLSLATVPVYAVGSASQAATVAQNQSQDKGQSKNQDVNTAAKQKQCERREKNVGIILGRIANRSQHHVDLFNTIATRVEQFATTNNKQPANYLALVDAVSTAHNNALGAVANLKAQSTSVDLKCTGTSTDAKDAGVTLQSDVKSEISALSAYRTAVRNLIVGVKSVVGTTNSSSSTGGSR